MNIPPLKHILKIITFALIVFVIIGGAFYIGYGVGRKVPETVVVSGVRGTLSQNMDADFSTFWQAWQIIHDNYLRDASTTNQQKVYGAINGLVNSLGDPYTDFFTPQENKEFTQDVQGNFGGIGAEIGARNQQVVVISALTDTPASRAGLRSLDRILSINATSTDGMSVDQAVQLIRGPVGSTVTLSIYRDGWAKPKDFKIVRDTIIIPTIDYRMKGNVAYVAIHEFNANVNLLFYRAILKAFTNNARGIVLDLRGDPGGYLNVAVDVAGWFIPRGTLVVSEATRNGTQDQLRANGNEALAKVPVVVLIDGGSASASEILAGALRDDRHAKLVGEKSFGKGTVQELEDLSNGSTIKLTIAHWVLPSGGILENGGLMPDVEVSSTEADAQDHRDAQLDKALEIVQSEINK